MCSVLNIWSFITGIFNQVALELNLQRVTKRDLISQVFMDVQQVYCHNGITFSVKAQCLLERLFHPNQDLIRRIAVLSVQSQMSS